MNKTEREQVGKLRWRLDNYQMPYSPWGRDDDVRTLLAIIDRQEKEIAAWGRAMNQFPEHWRIKPVME